MPGNISFDIETNMNFQCCLLSIKVFYKSFFSEFVLDSTMSNAAGFQYFGGTYVTVLSSKTSQRYRLQSDNLACLWILTESLQSRLAKRLANEKAPLECFYSSSLPMHEYYSEIELHFHKRKKLMALQEQLEQRSAQFRAIQKRLLSRFKDKTPTPLTNLDSLLEGIGFFLLVIYQQNITVLYSIDIQPAHNARLRGHASNGYLVHAGVHPT